MLKNVFKLIWLRATSCGLRALRFMGKNTSVVYKPLLAARSSQL